MNLLEAVEGMLHSVEMTADIYCPEEALEDNASPLYIALPAEDAEGLRYLMEKYVDSRETAGGNEDDSEDSGESSKYRKVIVSRYGKLMSVNSRL